jgi:hypothetical protein
MMRRRLFGVLVGSAAALMLIAAGPAAAATEFGNKCAGDGVAPGDYTITTVVSPEPLPVAAPAAGVITKLSVHSSLGIPFALPTAVKVLRPAGGGSFTAISEVTIANLGSESSVDARLPVIAGDQLGLHGLPFSFEGETVPGFTIYCGEIAGASLGAVVGDLGVGSTAEFPVATEGLAPISAVLEADADGDGYGDETQDLCPQSAATQAACPLITIDAVGKARRKLATVLVAASTETPVTVAATVKLGKGKTTRLRAAPKSVGPGGLVKFTLKFNRSLRKTLAKLPRKKKLTLEITASATNVIGQVSTDMAKTKLRGQG